MEKKSLAKEVPSYALEQVTEYERNLRDLFFQYLRRPIAGRRLKDDLLPKVAGLLGAPGMPGVWDTITAELRGEVLTKDHVATLSRRLAGNLYTLRNGGAVPPFDRQLGYEWVLVRVDLASHRDHELAIGMDIYSGLPAGVKMKKLLQQGEEVRLAHRMGLPRKLSRGIRPEELIGMECFVKLKPWTERSPKLTFSWLFARSLQRVLNRKLYESRRTDHVCPYRFKPRRYRECYECHVGYDPTLSPRSRACKFATHPEWRGNA